MLRQKLLPLVVWIFYRLLSWTWRKVILEPPEMIEDLREGRPIILAHWHGDELAVLHLVGRYRLCTMTSTSPDGQLIRGLIEKMGGSTSQGSSTRGGIGALKGLIRLLRAGRVASMALDGPRGPIHQAKPGVFELAKLSSARIYPLGVASSNSFVFQNSWNKAHLPYPFSKVIMKFTPPMEPPGEDADLKSLKLKDKLETLMSDARSQAAKLIAPPKGGC